VTAHRIAGLPSSATIGPLGARDSDGADSRKILVVLDGTESSSRAAAFAAGLACRHRATLVGLYVHTIGRLALTAEVVAAMRAVSAETVVAVRAELERQAATLSVNLVVVERDGNPYVEIVQVAQHLRVDAVVIGATPHLLQRLMGSPISRLVRQTEWPVTVVP
jgi:nucleotide-binding universal stress UspA family protein